MSNIKKIPKIKYFIFDLDGVLLDSRSNMKSAWSGVKKEMSINREFKEYEKYIGLPFQKILSKLKINLKKKRNTKNL